MIIIKPSPTADTRTCDYANVTKEQLKESSYQHIVDVFKAMAFFRDAILIAAERHDYDKLTDIDGFHRDFIGGFKNTTWWDNHRKVNRHHLNVADGIPNDVNLIDVLDMIADMVVARKGRGADFFIGIHPDILMAAFANTVELLDKEVVVENAD